MDDPHDGVEDSELGVAQLVAGAGSDSGSGADIGAGAGLGAAAFLFFAAFFAVFLAAFFGAAFLADFLADFFTPFFAAFLADFFAAFFDDFLAAFFAATAFLAFLAFLPFLLFFAFAIVILLLPLVRWTMSTGPTCWFESVERFDDTAELDRDDVSSKRPPAPFPGLGMISGQMLGAFVPGKTGARRSRFMP